MSSFEPVHSREVGRRILQFPAAIVIAGYYLLTAIVGPIIKPIVRGLAALRIVTVLSEAIERLGPYPSLILLAVPVIIIEPLKLGALVILGSGRIVMGTIALVVSHGLSLVLIERLFQTVKHKLLTLHWFAVLWGWFTTIRDGLLAWLYESWAWASVRRIRDVAKAAAAHIRSRLGLSN